ncbi:MAG TPA: hypothetical protein VFV99_03460 [Kofleriaceae bacterium]|nr:hypothetical protein [Kofleriaceae bacterium]
MRCTGSVLVVACLLRAVSSSAQPLPPQPPQDPAAPPPSQPLPPTAPQSSQSPSDPAAPPPSQPLPPTAPPPSQQLPPTTPQSSQPPPDPAAPPPLPPTAPPQLPPPVTPANVDHEQPKPREYRSILGIGVSGTLKPDWDQRFTIATELERNVHTGRFHLGWNIHWSFRNWSVIDAVYKQISADDISAPGKAFGYVFGWISGTSMLGAGWQLRYAQEDGAKGWALLGTRVVLFLDPIAGGEGDDVDASLSHALHGAIGYDFGDFGLGLRAMWAPDALLFGSTDSAPLFLSMATLELRKE